MMDYEKTYKVLEVIHESCVEFWMGEGKDDYTAYKMAELDIEGLVTNPFSPLGDTLNPDAKAAFLKKVEWKA